MAKNNYIFYKIFLKIFNLKYCQRRKLPSLNFEPGILSIVFLSTYLKFTVIP